MINIEELKKMDVKKLAEELANLQGHLIKLQFEIKTGQAKNTHELKGTKRQIARVKTLINSSK